MEKVVAVVVRVVIPYFYITLLAALYRESGLLPVKLGLEKRQVAWGLKLAKMGKERLA